MLPLFFLCFFMYNRVLFMENPEVKWKRFLFIPGGGRVEAKSCSCQRPVHSWAFMLLPFYPRILFLPGRKWTPTWWVFFLEITEDGLWIPLPFVEPGVRRATSCLWLCCSRVLLSCLCSYRRAFGRCMNLWPWESLPAASGLVWLSVKGF